MSLSSQTLGFFFSSFDSNTRKFLQEVVPPLPLAWARVTEGRTFGSQSRLLQLPSEILGLVLLRIDPDCLSALALVNSGCRQLARSRQFASVHFDYSDDSVDLIFHLCREGIERLESNGRTKNPSLGVYIRRLTMATHPKRVSIRHNRSPDEEIRALSQDVREGRKEKAARLFYDSYTSLIQRLLADPGALPSLGFLDWKDQILDGRLFFNSLTTSNIQHLKLSSIDIGETFAIGEYKGQHWRLRTLHLEMQPSLEKMNELNISSTCASILRLCAPTLESLTWLSGGNKRPYTFGNDVANPAPHMARLQTLRLGHGHCMDSGMWNALVKEGLRVLEVNTEADDSSAEFFLTCGAIPSLDTFVLRAFRIPVDYQLDFLRANTQLRQLSFDKPAAPSLLTTRLLPLVSQSFMHLTSLSLKWNSNSVQTSALELIKSLRSLERLHLSAGGQDTWAHDWLIDHDSMRDCLSQLLRLRRLAFSRCLILPFGVGGLYENMQVAGSRRMILAEAHEYMRVLPELEWLYLGQLPMRVSFSTRTKEKVVETLEEIDDCWTFLREMFDDGAE